MVWLKRKFALLFSIDLRSLAALRIGLGILLLVDLGIRSVDLTAHYTDNGILPRSIISDIPFRSLHFFSGGVAWQATLFVIAAATAVMLLIGYRTRLATCVSWLLLLSLQTRNPLVVNGGDMLLRMLLFWGMFLPLGRVWALDCLRQAKPSRNQVCSVATVAILVQVFLMYWMTGYFKYNEVWLEGQGLYYALSLDAYARPLASQLLEYPTLLARLSHVTVWFELIAPLLLFFPWGTKTLRCLLFVAFALFHLGIELCLTVGMFSYVSLAAWVLFLPDNFWNLFQKKSHEEPTESEHVGPPSPWKRLSRQASHVVCGAALLYVLLWNYSSTTLPWANHAMPYSLKPIGTVTKISQHWNMFGPAPVHDGWCVAVALLKNGDTVDLLREGEKVDWSRPPRMIDLNPNHRWRKFYRVLFEEKYLKYRAPLCRYLARQWNQTHSPDQEVRLIDLYFLEEKTLPPGKGTEDALWLLHREVLLPGRSNLDELSTPLPGMDQEVPGL